MIQLRRQPNGSRNVRSTLSLKAQQKHMKQIQKVINKAKLVTLSPQHKKRETVMKQISLELYYQLQKDDSVEVDSEIDPKEIKEILKKKFSQITKSNFNKLYEMLNKTLLAEMTVDKDIVITCCTCLTLQNNSAGRTLYKKYQVVNNFMVLLTGSLDIMDSNDALVVRLNSMDVFDRKYCTEKGDYFTSQYLVKTSSDCSFAIIEIKEYQKILQERGQQARNLKQQFLQSVGLFAEIPRQLLVRLTYYLDEVTFIKDQYVYKEGDANINRIYIIYEGEFKITKKFTVQQDDKEQMDQKRDTMSSINEKQIMNTSKRSVFKQPLVKTFCLRFLNSKQVVGLEEVLEKYDNNAVKKFKDPLRKYSVQCVSQTAKMLVIYQDLFFDNFYNVNATAKANTKKHNEDQIQDDIQIQKGFKTFLNENSQFVVYDKQRNQRNSSILIQENDREQQEVQFNEKTSYEEIDNAQTMQTFCKKDQSLQQHASSQSVDIQSSLMSMRQQSLNTFERQDKNYETIRSVGFNNTGSHVYINLYKIHIQYRLYILNLKSVAIKKEVTLPHINEFENIKDRNKVLGREERVRLNNIKRSQLNKNYDLELIYRARHQNRTPPNYSTTSTQLMPDKPSRQKKKIYIDFFQNQFLTYNIVKNQTFVINQQIVKMKTQNESLNREQKSQFTGLGIDSQHIQVEDQWQQQQQRIEYNNKSQSIFPIKSNYNRMKEKNQVTMRKKAVRDYYHYFNVDEVNNKRLHQSQCVFKKH